MSLDALKASIALKKQEAERLKQQALVAAAGAVPASSSSQAAAEDSAKPAPPAGPKYVRRGDLLGTAPAATAPADSQGKQEDAADSGAPQSQSLSTSGSKPKMALGRLQLTPAEAIRALRKYGQVVTYFGESDQARLLRLEAYEIEHVMEKQEFAVGHGFDRVSSRGGKHTSRSDEEEEDADEEAMSRPAGHAAAAGGIKKRRTEDGRAALSSSSSSSTAAGGAGAGGASDAAGAGSAGSSATAASAGGVAGSSSGSGSASKAAAAETRHRTKSSDALAYKGKDDWRFIYTYFKGLLNEWQEELDGEPIENKSSSRWKEGSRTLKQTKDFMRPFLHMCKEQKLPSDMKKFTVQIVSCCLDREYVKAGDSYYSMAIGNAAWPIGVSAVGLHERAAREKVAEGQQAHVMHNEEQRRFITSIKRLITFAEGRYKTVPSKTLFS